MPDLREYLEQTADHERILIDYFKISFSKSFIVDSSNGYCIILDRSQIESAAEELALLAHELGHYFTGSLYNRDSPLLTKARCEFRANAWAIGILCPVGNLIQAKGKGFHTIHELADALALTDQTVSQALDFYQSKGLL